MKKLYTLLAIALFTTHTIAQISKSGDNIMVSPKFTTDQTYHYEMVLKKIVQDGEQTNIVVENTFPVELTLYGEGEGFNLFEWKSAPMLFFKNNEDGNNFTFPNQPISIKYRTDENYILGEVSNYDEVIQDYSTAYQQLYNDSVTNYEDLASKSALYFVQMFHMFFGQEFNSKNKEQMMNLFFNPMRNTFTAAEDEIIYTEIDKKAGFSFVQKYSTEMEDNSAKMMNHKTVDSYRSQQNGTDYSMKAWGNQTFLSDGLIDEIVRIVEVKQNGKVIQFISTLQKK